MDDNNTCNYLLFYINAGYKRVLNTQASNFIYSLSILGHIDFEMEVGKLIKFQIVKKDKPASKKKSSKEKRRQKKLYKDIKQNNVRVQDLMFIKEIRDNCVLTRNNQEIYYLVVTPKNISVMSDYDITTLIDNLSSIISNFAQNEIICLNSTQSYETNKKYLHSLAATENNAAIKKLDNEDIKFLDKIQISMAANRTFLIVLRKYILIDDDKKRLQDINMAINKCRAHNYIVELATKDEIKRMLSIYYEQNVYQDQVPDFDGHQYDDTLDSEVYDLKKYVDMIAPSVMDFKHTSYYCIGNTFRRVWAVREYATATKKLTLLKKLGEKEGITLHIYNRLVAPSEKRKVFNKAVRKNKASSYSNDVNEKIESQETLNDISKVLSNSFKSKEAFVYCSVYIEMIENSLENLDNLSNEVDSILMDSNIVPDKLRVQQKDGYIAVSPTGYNIFDREFERVLPSSSVANLFPLSYSGKTDEMGLYIGKDENGSNIIVDFDKRAADKTNGHIAVFGNSGEGKSFLLKLLTCLFRQQGKSLFSVDVDSEYVDLTNALGGTNIDMMSGNYFINPLEVKVLKTDDDDEDTDAPEAISKGTLLAQHIAYLRDFFRVYKPELTSNQLDILEIMLEETYKLFHINENTNFAELKPIEWPICSDLYRTAENALNSYDDTANGKNEMLYRKEDLRSLLLSIRSMCCGTDARFFNGYTNITNSAHVNFVITGLLSTNENLKNAMYFNIFSYMQHMFFTAGNTVVELDELHEIVKSSIVVLYIRSFIKRGRKKDSDVVIASQNIDDLMLPGIIEYTRPLFSIPTHSFFAYPGKVDTKQFMSVANLNDTEYNLINKSNRGHFLYCCGSERYMLHVIAPPYKSSLFGTAGGN